MRPRVQIPGPRPISEFKTGDLARSVEPVGPRTCHRFPRNSLPGMLSKVAAVGRSELRREQSMAPNGGRADDATARIVRHARSKSHVQRKQLCGFGRPADDVPLPEEELLALIGA